MALPNFMLDTEQRIRDENQTTLDDHFTRLVRDFSTVAPRAHNHVSNTIDTLNAHVADTRFGIDYATVDPHVETSIRAMVSDLYQNGTEHLFNDNLTRRERIIALGTASGRGMSQKITTDRIMNLNRPDMVTTIQDHITEYHTTATHNERDQIASQLRMLADRAHSAYNLRGDLAALADTPYTILIAHGL